MKTQCAEEEKFIMPQRVERIIINRSHPNRAACARLCSLARKLGNCASYILRHRLFDQKAPYTRAEPDQALREQYPQDYRAMPSAASAQRQGQIVAKQFKFFAKASAEYKSIRRNSRGNRNCPATVTNIVHFALEGTVIRSRTIA